MIALSIGQREGTKKVRFHRIILLHNCGNFESIFIGEFALGVFTNSAYGSSPPPDRLRALLASLSRGGFILGFASTPVEEIPHAVRKLRNLIMRATPGSRQQP